MNKSFLFLGGDQRQLYAEEFLRKKGFKTLTCGFKNNDNPPFNENFDYLVLPAPVTKDGVNIYTPFSEDKLPFSILKNFNTPKLIFGGSTDILKNFVSCEIFDLLKCEQYNILNATATAEGAISLAIEKTPFNLRGSLVLVCGYGKIGKILARDLSGMGAKVSVAARNITDLSYAEIFSYNALEYKDLLSQAEKFDIIFNTVPALIIKEEIILKLKKRCFVIDLASKPGGCDFDCLDKNGIGNILALGLPGKYSPETSGEIIAEIILKITGGKN